MIIIEAEVQIDKGCVGGDKIFSGFRCTMKISEKGYISQLITLVGDSIPVDTKSLVEMKVLYRELNIKSFQENEKFEFISGRPVGNGRITKVKEIYVEKDAIEDLDNIELAKDIVSYAETLPNAIIFENVYELLKK